CDLPPYRDIGEAGVHRCRGGLSARTVKSELDERNELVQRLVLWRGAVEATGEIKWAVLDRKTPKQRFDNKRQNRHEIGGRHRRTERTRTCRSQDWEPALWRGSSPPVFRRRSRPSPQRAEAMTANPANRRNPCRRTGRAEWCEEHLRRSRPSRCDRCPM